MLPTLPGIQLPTTLQLTLARIDNIATGGNDDPQMSSSQRFHSSQSISGSSLNSTRSSYSGQPPAKMAHYDASIVQAAQSRQLISLSSSPRRLAAAPNASAQIAPLQISRVFPYEPASTKVKFMERLDREWPKKKTTERPTGLRHFSTKVCEKVKQKGLTNYNEVADELVAEYFETNMVHNVDQKQEYEMKNIRRRVYDALNVLLAMNIIEKNKKDIRWVGLPASSAQEIKRLEDEKSRREERIRNKLEDLQEMIIQLVSYKSLVTRNREHEKKYGRPDQNSLLYLPFIIVNTDKRATVECSVSGDKSEYLFSFNAPFEIHDDVEVLKRMGLTCGLDSGHATDAQREEAKELLPPLLQPYIDDIVSHSNSSRQEEGDESEDEYDYEEHDESTEGSPPPLPPQQQQQQQHQQSQVLRGANTPTTFANPPRDSNVARGMQQPPHPPVAVPVQPQHQQAQQQMHLVSMPQPQQHHQQVHHHHQQQQQSQQQQQQRVVYQAVMNPPPAMTTSSAVRSLTAPHQSPTRAPNVTRYYVNPNAVTKHVVAKGPVAPQQVQVVRQVNGRHYQAHVRSPQQPRYYINRNLPGSSAVQHQQGGHHHHQHQQQHHQHQQQHHQQQQQHLAVNGGGRMGQPQSVHLIRPSQQHHQNQNQNQQQHRRQPQQQQQMQPTPSDYRGVYEGEDMTYMYDDDTNVLIAAARSADIQYPS